ncbi:limb region 1 protein homolog [Gigantopelta aegis]|uniref:limb region 1 protein homolog n=1 Tax=Gigantopelta aegis TaxID=1735272 RepID=UPI001B88D234|nr:limb region 1 protein homolog [Gigantopelta aegis]
MEDDLDISLREQVFHNAVREYIITLLLYLLLYVCSYVTICQIRKRTDSEDMYAGDDDAVVYRISLWLCTFTLSFAAGAVLLLPISIVSNEVLHLYPDSYYVQWLNSSLIQSLWNQIFLFSNMALFILMPFAFFFTESEGFSGSKKGIMARVKETAVVLFLLAVLVLGLAWVASAILSDDQHSKQTLSDVWHIYLPYLYSCISFIGVLVLLLCTPVGVARMFTVMGQLVVKPKFLRDIEDELFTVKLEEENLIRKIKYGNNVPCEIANGHTDPAVLRELLQQTQTDKLELEKRQRVSSLRRNLCYPVVMLLLLALTVFCILTVAHNTVMLLVGIKALPAEAKDTVLGISSLSMFGTVGAAVQILLILYLMSASVVGFYSLPLFCKLHPRVHDTSLVSIIGNCVVILVLSSALPILSKTLGITNFDLIGNFGSMDWLGNFYIIFLYNVIFAVGTALGLATKFTATIRREIYNRLKTAFRRDKRTTPGSSASASGGLKEE